MSKPSKAIPIDAALPKPPPARGPSKGAPPASPGATAALTNYLNKPGKDARVGLNTMVASEFRADLKVWSAQHGMTMGEALQKGFELLKEKHR